ncbi:MAG: 4Fe-4S binding protein [Proteobacteria bacterium]|nr:4Fe-4S binding protein [Pseudomonadota bacterium]
MPKSKKAKQTIIINTEIGGFATADRPTPAHHKIMARYASPLLNGPPKSDDLLEMVCHMYTEEEAELVKHLPIFRPRTAEKIAEKSGRSLADVKRIMDHLALDKKVVLASGSPRKYTILPIVPGTFEMALMTNDLKTRTVWHQKFAQIFERIWESEYMKSYDKNSVALVRALPVQKLAPTLQQAWPSDKLEEVLDHYDDFGLTHCQCRQTTDMMGQGCGKPMENCASFGAMVKPLVERGMMRRVDKAEMIAVKKDAEENGLVTWVMNAGTDVRGNGSCSCCGCCCHALRTVNELSVPGLISRPHFMPEKNNELCTSCGKCIKACPMGSWSQFGPRMHFDRVRCIGCGLCVVACKAGALGLAPYEEADVPEKDYTSLLLKSAPGFIYNTVSVFARRLFR